MRTTLENLGGRRGRVGLIITLTSALALLMSEPTRAPGQTPTVEPTPATAAWEAEWEKIAAAARQEGELVIIATGSAAAYRPVFEYFGKKFGVKITHVTGRSRTHAERLVTEQRVGRYDVDIFFPVRSVLHQVLIPNNALEPIFDVVFLPDILDKSRWFGNRHIWADSETQRYAYNFAVQPGPAVEVYFRTDRWSEKEIAAIDSAWGFVDPQRFKGQIAALSPFAGRSYVQEISHPDLGEKWIRAFFDPKLGVFFLTADRLVSDALLTGEYSMVLSPGRMGREFDELIGQGAPLAIWPNVRGTEPVKDANVLSAHGGSLNLGLVKRAPNSNAAKLFINWWLSREGQTAMHTMSSEPIDPTRRLDVTEFDMVPEVKRLDPNGSYFWPDDPIYDDPAGAALRAQKLFSEIRGGR